jgi:hypothetical protein
MTARISRSVQPDTPSPIFQVSPVLRVDAPSTGAKSGNGVGMRYVIALRDAVAQKEFSVRKLAFFSFSKRRSFFKSSFE